MDILVCRSTVPSTNIAPHDLGCPEGEEGGGEGEMKGERERRGRGRKERGERESEG